MIKLERKHRQRIVLGIGIIIILFGLLQALFRFEIDRKITDQVTFVLMIIAAALLFTKDRKKSEDNNIAGAEKGNDMLEPVKDDDGKADYKIDAVNNDIIADEKESVDEK